MGEAQKAEASQLLETVGLGFEHSSLAPSTGSVQGSGSLRGGLNTVKETAEVGAVWGWGFRWEPRRELPGCFSRLCRRKGPSGKGSPAVCTQLGPGRVGGEFQGTIHLVEQ